MWFIEVCSHTRHVFFEPCYVSCLFHSKQGAAPVQHPSAEIPKVSQESQKTFSLGKYNINRAPQLGAQ